MKSIFFHNNSFDIKNTFSLKSIIAKTLTLLLLCQFFLFSEMFALGSSIKATMHESNEALGKQRGKLVAWEKIKTRVLVHSKQTGGKAVSRFGFTHEPLKAHSVAGVFPCYNSQTVLPLCSFIPLEQLTLREKLNLYFRPLSVFIRCTARN